MSDQILVLFRKQLGDLLILQPAIALLGERHGLPVQVFCREGMADLLSLMPGLVSRAPQWPARYQAIYSFDPKPGATLYAALARSREKHLLLTRRSHRRAWHRLAYDQFAFLEERALYRAEIFYRLAGGQPADFRPPRLNPPPAEWSLPALPDNYVLIHPTAAWRQKCWDPKAWLEALSQYREDQYWVVTSGVAEWEISLGKEIITGLGKKAIDFCGKTSLRQYIALIQRASAVLCVDGSASHLAAAFEVPCLTLFGPTNSIQWHYQTEKNIKIESKQVCNKVSDMDKIDPVDVSKALINFLGK